MAFFHKNRGFLINYPHVLHVKMISRYSQIKSKPILERRMIALTRHISIRTCRFYVEKWQNSEKIGQKIHFFLKSLSRPASRDLDRDIWQITFKLVVFYEIIIGKAQAFSIFVLEEGGPSSGSPCI